MKCLEFRVCLVVLPIIQIRKVTWSSMPSQAAVCGRRPCGYGFWDVSKFSTKKLQILPTQHLDLRDTGTDGNLERVSFLETQHNKIPISEAKRDFLFALEVLGVLDSMQGCRTMPDEVGQPWIHWNWIASLESWPEKVSVNSAISACAQGSRWIQVRLPKWRDWIFDVWWWPTKRGCWKPGNPILGWRTVGNPAAAVKKQYIPSLKLAVCTRKLMVGRWFPFGWPIFRAYVSFRGSI